MTERTPDPQKSLSFGTFSTVINCMDGRTQIPVLQHLIRRFGRANVDSITEAGPVGILACESRGLKASEILRKVEVSINAHGSQSLALVAHYDCAGHPFARARQLDDLGVALHFLGKHYPQLEVIGLWVDGEGVVEEVSYKVP